MLIYSPNTYAYHLTYMCLYISSRLQKILQSIMNTISALSMEKQKQNANYVTALFIPH